MKLSNCSVEWGSVYRIIFPTLIYTGNFKKIFLFKVCHNNPSERARFIRCIYNLLNSQSPAVRYEAAGTLVTLSSAPTAVKVSCVRAFPDLFLDPMNRLISNWKIHTCILSNDCSNFNQVLIRIRNNFWNKVPGQKLYCLKLWSYPLKFLNLNNIWIKFPV